MSTCRGGRIAKQDRRDDNEGRPARTRIAGGTAAGATLGSSEPQLPRDLRAFRFDLGGDAFAVVEFSLPGEQLASDRRLTPAEREVVRLMLQGKSNVEIATTRGTTVRTVANQVARVFDKLGVRGRLQLYALAQRR